MALFAQLPGEVTGLEVGDGGILYAFCCDVHQCGRVRVVVQAH